MILSMLWSTSIWGDPGWNVLMKFGGLFDVPRVSHVIPHVHYRFGKSPSFGCTSSASKHKLGNQLKQNDKNDQVSTRGFD